MDLLKHYTVQFIKLFVTVSHINSYVLFNRLYYKSTRVIYYFYWVRGRWQIFVIKGLPKGLDR